MRFPKSLTAAIVTLFAFCATTRAGDAPANDPTPLIQSALDAYKTGQIQQAIDELQKAIAILQQSQREGLARYFPDAPSGWEAGKLDSNSFSAGGNDADKSFSYTTLSRPYTNKSNQTRVTLTLANSPQLIETYSAMLQNFQNVQMLAAINQDTNSHTELVDQDGWKGWSTVTKGQDAKLISFNGSYSLTVEVDKDDKADMEIFWKAIDLKGLSAQVNHAKTAGK